MRPKARFFSFGSTTLKACYLGSDRKGLTNYNNKGHIEFEIALCYFCLRGEIRTHAQTRPRNCCLPLSLPFFSPSRLCKSQDSLRATLPGTEKLFRYESAYINYLKEMLRLRRCLGDGWRRRATRMRRTTRTRGKC